MAEVRGGSGELVAGSFGKAGIPSGDSGLAKNSPLAARAWDGEAVVRFVGALIWARAAG